MIIPVHNTFKNDKYIFYFYLIVHGRDSAHPTVKISGDEKEVTREIKYLMLTDLVSNLSTFVCHVYKDVDKIELLSDKEVVNNLYRVLEKMVHMKDQVVDSHKQEREYVKIAKGILKYRKELFSVVHVLGKDYGRYAQYVALINSCNGVVEEGVNKYFKQG